MPGLKITLAEGTVVKNTFLRGRHLIMKQTGGPLDRLDFARLQKLHDDVSNIVPEVGGSTKLDSRTRTFQFPALAGASDYATVAKALVAHYEAGMRHCGLKVVLEGFPEPPERKPLSKPAPVPTDVPGSFEGFEARMVRLHASGHEVKVHTPARTLKLRPWVAVVSQGTGTGKRWGSGAGHTPNEALYNAEVNFRRSPIKPVS